MIRKWERDDGWIYTEPKLDIIFDFSTFPIIRIGKYFSVQRPSSIQENIHYIKTVRLKRSK